MCVVLSRSKLPQLLMTLRHPLSLLSRQPGPTYRLDQFQNGSIKTPFMASSWCNKQWLQPFQPQACNESFVKGVNWQTKNKQKNSEILTSRIVFFLTNACPQLLRFSIAAKRLCLQFSRRRIQDSFCARLPF